MHNPFEILGLTATADEAEVRARYLQLVREFPPDRAPERFAEIRAAFDALSDRTTHLEEMLFRHTTKDSLHALRSDIGRRLSGAQLGVQALLSLADGR